MLFHLGNGNATDQANILATWRWSFCLGLEFIAKLVQVYLLRPEAKGLTALMGAVQGGFSIILTGPPGIPDHSAKQRGIACD